MSEPPMLFGLSPDPNSPTPTLIPREIAEQIRRTSPAMAMALGITDEAMHTGVLELATATPRDFPELRNMRVNVYPEDVHPRVIQTLRQQRAHQRAASRPNLGPRDALALHAELRSATISDAMQRWIGCWLTGFDTRSAVDADDIPPEVAGAGLIYCAELREMLRECPTYLVAAEANPLITAAAEGLPWSVACFPDTPPSADGFLAFAAPYEIADAEGNVMRIRAATWTTAPNHVKAGEIFDGLDLEGWPADVQDGVLLSFWGEVDDPPPITEKEAREIANVKAALGTRLVIAQTFPMPLRVPLQDWPTFARFLDRGQAEGITGPVAMIISTWMLMRQPVMSVGRGTLPPRLRKEIRKKGRIRGDISVINLRHRPPVDHLPAEGESARREYHFRWTVRGHWRHQAMGPGRKEREWIYIWAHIKGPADRPLRQRQRVYRVSGRP